jgi:NAD(P)-dependent dehydrogenase (short-subunit alcohol dehydrogenase family)
MTTVLVTGATGYLGGAAARALRTRGHRVLGTTRTSAAAETLLAAGVRPVDATLEAGSAALLRCPQWTAPGPNWRMSRSTRPRPVWMPSRRSWRRIFLAPYTR